MHSTNQPGCSPATGESTIDIAGDELTCFTAPLAAYIAKEGGHPRIAVGLQLSLSVRVIEGRWPPDLAFIHFHTPLRGRDETLSANLRRQRSPDPDDAWRGILKEVREQGQTIVASDAWEVHWHVYHKRQRAPHWVLIDQVEGAGDRVHVTDLLELATASGVQGAHTGWLEAETVRCLARKRAYRYAPAAMRERYAFGDDADDQRWAGTTDAGTTDEDEEAATVWFSAERRPGMVPGRERATATAMLQRSLDAMRGRSLDSVYSAGWVNGLDAIGCLAEYFSCHEGRIAAYRWKEDLWVISRTRALFASSLQVLAAEGVLPPEFDKVGRWCAQVVCPKWAAVVRVAEYNHARLAGGSLPRKLIAPLLKEIVWLEQQLCCSLATTLTRSVSVVQSVQGAV